MQLRHLSIKKENYSKIKLLKSSYWFWLYYATFGFLLRTLYDKLDAFYVYKAFDWSATDTSLDKVITVGSLRKQSRVILC